MPQHPAIRAVDKLAIFALNEHRHHVSPPFIEFLDCLKKGDADQMPFCELLDRLFVFTANHVDTFIGGPGYGFAITVVTLDFWHFEPPSQIC